MPNSRPKSAPERRGGEEEGPGERKNLFCPSDAVEHSTTLCKSKKRKGRNLFGVQMLERTKVYLDEVSSRRRGFFFRILYVRVLVLLIASIIISSVIILMLLALVPRLDINTH